MVCWMADEAALEPGRDYIIKHTTRTTRARVGALDYRLDVNTLHRDKSATALKLNELGRVTLRTQVPLLLDEYSRNAATGIVHPDRPRHQRDRRRGHGSRHRTGGISQPRHPTRCATSRWWPPEDRLTKGRTLWFTGLSGSGKSSVAVLVEQKLLEHGCPAYILDGDNLRHGLNADLGFSMADRAENLRRLAHIATLMADAGLTVLVPVISPLEEHRDLARKVHSDQGVEFFEIFVDTPLDDCERRDPKGLYAKARAGEITHFTGIDSPYQRPKNPDLRLTPEPLADELAQQVVRAVGTRLVNDHELAAALATKAGQLLLDVRVELADAPAAERKAAGDKRSHDFLMEALAAGRPDDAVLSEEGADDPIRLRSRRVWIVDPLDGTREFSELDRNDWAVHVALWQDGELIAGAVALPAQGVTLATPTVPAPPAAPAAPRIVVSRTRPPDIACKVRDRLNGTLVEMGSAGAKVAAVVQGLADVYVHAGGQYEWDSAAPVAVARAAGLHTSRIDGSPLQYNQPDPSLPDLVVCRPEYAEAVLAVTR